ncbi:MAG TPA: radical SAM protein [Verrucomicrobiales bacterium]|nr:radical SAM protein [Verrucomicrobiales bacterium]
MKIGLISMSGVRVKSAELAALGVTLPGFIRRGKVIASLPSLGLLTVAALTPPEHEVSYHEIIEPGEAEALPDYDLVGISALTARIDAAYQVAGAYRCRGTKVVMGGLHVSALPEEAMSHCDVVVTGGAEVAWPQVVQDAVAGKLQRRYDGARAGVFTPPLYVRPRFDFLAGREYNRVTVQTSRGCPRDCEFCASSPRITSRFNQKPVPLVIDEIREARRHFKAPFFEFADDNTLLNKSWGREFLTELRREEIRWFTETDASVADDPALCDLLAESGCRQVLIGMESPRAGDLEGMDPQQWKRTRAPEGRRVIDELQSRGVSVNGCFILGLDAQTPDIFPVLRDFVRNSGLAEVQITVLTPFPGTALYYRLRGEGRLLRDCRWDACTLFDVCHRPQRMTVEELETGLRWLFEELYSPSETASRKRTFVRQAAAAVRGSTAP